MIDVFDAVTLLSWSGGAADDADGRRNEELLGLIRREAMRLDSDSTLPEIEIDFEFGMTWLVRSGSGLLILQHLPGDRHFRVGQI